MKNSGAVWLAFGKANIEADVFSKAGKLLSKRWPELLYSSFPKSS